MTTLKTTRGIICRKAGSSVWLVKPFDKLSAWSCHFELKDAIHALLKGNRQGASGGSGVKVWN